MRKCFGPLTDMIIRLNQEADILAKKTLQTSLGFCFMIPNIFCPIISVSQIKSNKPNIMDCISKNIMEHIKEYFKKMLL
jgi:hypothetical protein